MTDLLLRPAEQADLPAVATLMTRSRDAAFPAMPRSLHTAEEDQEFVGGWDLADREVWVALRDERVVGFAALTATWLDFLYVDPDHARRGVGTALVELAQARRPDGFGLWVFAANAPARALYLRHGFIEVEHTDGSGNEEGEPDVRMAWNPS